MPTSAQRAVSIRRVTPGLLKNAHAEIVIVITALKLIAIGVEKTLVAGRAVIATTATMMIKRLLCQLLKTVFY